MQIVKLSRKMRTPQERGIVADCLFGENYIKEGGLYLRREPKLPPRVIADIMGELGRGRCQVMDFFIEGAAEMIGLRLLKAKDVCLDLVQALDNVGMGKLRYEIPSEDSLNDRLKAVEKDHAFCNLTNILYGCLNCTVYSPNDQDLFTIGFPQEFASEELVITPRQKRIEQFSTRDILAAYHQNLSCLSKTEEDCERLFP